MAAVTVFHGPNVKVYSRSLRAEISLSLGINQVVKSKPYCKFPSDKLKQHESRGLSLRPLVPMASSSVGHGQETPRVVKTFPPNLWADLSFSFDKQVHERYREAVQTLKEEVRSMITAKDSTPNDKMILIDTLERLGVAYHFEQEIEDQIEQIFKFHAEDENGEHDLFTTALYFRVFNKFMDEDNKFKKTLISDINGLLSLYEASYLSRFIGPLKNLKLVTTSMYEKKESKNELLLKLAKLDFNFLQNLYKEEISHLFKWRKETNIISKLPYMRDRVMECYFWMVGIHFEPEYSFSRTAATKALVRGVVLNDTYGNYATLEELKLFTESLQRWDIKEIDRLPDYMKFAYHFLYSIREECDHEVPKHGKTYGVSYVIEALKILATAYYKKAKWYMGQEMPTFEDHVSNGHRASGAAVVFAGMFMGMESASKEAFDWLMSEPKIVEAAGLLTRHMNDISTYDREHEEGVFPTPVDCYMIENGVSKQEALDKIFEHAEDQWKTINKEWIASTVPRHWMKPILNYARIQDATYKGGKDLITDPMDGSGQDQIVALFIDPIVI
ncbi:hypothetical protein BUALT_Bualt13G0060300 [Buddleja alternifolia]|uniref:Uncharacterized protein n=1 Tax=Buddleja alternifolia TaxID=168488 RepID=A0AAV6WKV8_9LAMI|nr:hypothetical protein BUALT_Bualt13G0060300 [Buddleja alternifolia]